LLVSQDGCWNDLQGEQWAGVTWVEPGMDTLFVPYGYDDVIIETVYACTAPNFEYWVNNNLVIVLLNPPGQNFGNTQAFTLQETRVHLSLGLPAVKVISWTYLNGWYQIKQNGSIMNPGCAFHAGSGECFNADLPQSQFMSFSFRHLGQLSWAFAE
jgi:hypothetical protein